MALEIANGRGKTVRSADLHTEYAKKPENKSEWALFAISLSCQKAVHAESAVSSA